MERGSSDESNGQLQNGAFLALFTILYRATISMTGFLPDPVDDEDHLYQGFSTIQWPSMPNINLGTLLQAILMHEDIYSSFDSAVFPAIFNSIVYMGSDIYSNSHLLAPVHSFYVLSNREFEVFTRTSSIYFRSSTGGEVFTAIEFYKSALQAFYHLAYLFNTKGYANPIYTTSNTFYLLVWRPMKNTFREFYTQSTVKGTCLYVNSAPYQFHEGELSTLIVLEFVYDFSSFLTWGLPKNSMLRVFGRFVDPTFNIPASMIIGSAEQSTIQAYALLGSALINLIYREAESKEKAIKQVYFHQERVLSALPHWEEGLSSEQLSNLQSILSFDDSTYDPAASSTTPADHVSTAQPPAGESNEDDDLNEETAQD